MDNKYYLVYRKYIEKDLIEPLILFSDREKTERFVQQHKGVKFDIDQKYDSNMHKTEYMEIEDGKMIVGGNKPNNHEKIDS